MEINFQGQYQKRQYFRGVYRANKPKQNIVILRISLFILFTAIFIAVILSEGQDGFDTAVIYRLGRHSLTFLALLFFVLQPFIKSYQTASRFWKDPIIRSKIAGSISNRGIAYGSYVQPWDNFIIKDVQEDMVVLLTKDRIMSILPRNFFASERDWEQLVLLVEQKVKEPK